MKLIIFLMAIHLIVNAQAQPTIKVEVSSDTVSIGEDVQITYTIENGEGKFNIPDMTGLPLISGPNTSSSFMYQNGKTTSSQSYSFLFRPLEDGKIIIPQTTYQTKEEKLVIQPVEIVVVMQKDKPGSPKSYSPAPTVKSPREKRKF